MLDGVGTLSVTGSHKRDETCIARVRLPVWLCGCDGHFKDVTLGLLHRPKIIKCEVSQIYDYDCV